MGRGALDCPDPRPPGVTWCTYPPHPPSRISLVGLSVRALEDHLAFRSASNAESQLNVQQYNTNIQYTQHNTQLPTTKGGGYESLFAPALGSGTSVFNAVFTGKVVRWSEVCVFVRSSLERLPSKHPNRVPGMQGGGGKQYIHKKFFDNAKPSFWANTPRAQNPVSVN